MGMFYDKDWNYIGDQPSPSKGNGNGKKKSKIRKIASKAKEQIGKLDADVLERLSGNFSDFSKLSASPNLSGGGQIQSQGGPEKVAFRADQYDEKAKKLLDQLNA